MTSDMEPLFIYLFTIHISFLLRYLLRPLAHVLTGWFVFLPLSFKSSLYILGNSCLSDVSFASGFS